MRPWCSTDSTLGFQPWGFGSSPNGRSTNNQYNMQIIERIEVINTQLDLCSLDSFWDNEPYMASSTNHNILKLNNDTDLNIIDIIKSDTNWHSYFSVVHSVQGLNSPEDRFLKSIFIDKAFSRFSGGNFEYTQRSIGKDFRYVGHSSEIFLEHKSFAKKLITPQKRNIIDSISLKLLNSNGENKHTELPEDYAGWLMVTDLYSCAVANTSALKGYISAAGDGLSLLNCPSKLFTMVHMLEKDVVLKHVDINAKELIDVTMDEYIREFDE